MRIILIRHAQTEANLKNSKVYQLVGGCQESHLTISGRQEAAALKKVELLDGFDLVISSPSQRALETASLVTNGQREILVDDRLHERSLGECEGKTVAELRTDPRYSTIFKDTDAGKKFRHSFSYRLPGGENYSDVVTRTRACFEEIQKIPGVKKVVIFSHMVTIRCILHWTLELSEQETLNLKIPNCSPFVIEMKDGETNLLSPSRNVLYI